MAPREPAVTNTLRKLISLRKGFGYSQTFVAKKMGVTKQQISNLEREGYGDPSIRTIERYAKAIGCKLSVLVD